MPKVPGVVLESLTAESPGGIFTVPPRVRKRVGFLWLDCLILKLNSVDGGGGWLWGKRG